jgi:hypothetical protein
MCSDKGIRAAAGAAAGVPPGTVVIAGTFRCGPAGYG